MYGSYQVTRLPDITEKVICTIHPEYDCYKQVTKWLPSFIGKIYGSYQVTRLPDITEEVIYNQLLWLLQAGYQMVTKLYRENVWKLPSYQVTRYNRGSNMFNPSLI